MCNNWLDSTKCPQRQSGCRYVNKAVRFVLFFIKQRCLRWSKFRFCMHMEVVSPGQICKWGCRNCWKPSGNGLNTDIPLTLLPSVQLLSRNMSTAISGATAEAARFCCTHFPQDEHEAEWIYLRYTPPWNGWSRLFFHALCFGLSEGTVWKWIKSKSGVSVGGGNQMVDQELKAHDELLPRPHRETIYGRGDGEDVHKKGKNRGYCVAGRHGCRKSTAPSPGGEACLDMWRERELPAINTCVSPPNRTIGICVRPAWGPHRLSNIQILLLGLKGNCAAVWTNL